MYLNLIHRAEPNKYYRHGLNAEAKPNSYLSIMMDGKHQN